MANHRCRQGLPLSVCRSCRRWPLWCMAEGGAAAWDLAGTLPLWWSPRGRRCMGPLRDAAALVVVEGPPPRGTLCGQLPLWWSSRGHRHVGPLAGPLPLWWSPRGRRRRARAMVVAGAAVPRRPCTATAWESARECRRRPSPCSTVEIPRQGPPRSSSVGVIGQRCGERIRREREGLPWW
jgi:hypothetical protein